VRLPFNGRLGEAQEQLSGCVSNVEKLVVRRDDGTEAKYVRALHMLSCVRSGFQHGFLEHGLDGTDGVLFQSQ
jgi:hypothetical protein